MCEDRKSSAKWLGSSLYGHLRLWVYSLRTNMMAVFILLLAFMLVKGQEQVMSAYGYENVYLGETLFIYINSGFNLSMTTVGLLVMMSEIPKRVAYQHYTLMRLSRGKWLAALVIFCIGVVLAFTLLLTILSALLSLSFVTPGSGWSDLERITNDPYAVYEPMLVPEFVREVSPVTACMLALTILFFFWVTLVLLILQFSLWGVPNFGLVLCVSLVMAHITILFESLPGLSDFLPTRYATLSAVAGQVKEHQFRHALFVIACYIVADTCLIALMAARVQRMDIQFTGKG